jgi:hypothetical protein
MRGTLIKSTLWTLIHLHHGGFRVVWFDFAFFVSYGACITSFGAAELSFGASAVGVFSASMMKASLEERLG